MTTMITVYLLLAFGGSMQNAPAVVDRYSTRENCENAQRILPAAVIRTHCVAHKVEVFSGAERVK